MLKPNLNGEEGCTNRELVEALIGLLRDFGVREVFIGESTFGDARTTAALFRQTGYAELAAKHAIRLCNLNESDFVEVPVTRPLLTGTLRVAREFLEADRVINLPNLKVHYATGMTLALKNLPSAHCRAAAGWTVPERSSSDSATACLVMRTMIFGSRAAHPTHLR